MNDNIILFQVAKWGVLFRVFGLGFYVSKDDGFGPLYSDRLKKNRIYRVLGLRVKLFTWANN